MQVRLSGDCLRSSRQQWPAGAWLTHWRCSLHGVRAFTTPALQPPWYAAASLRPLRRDRGLPHGVAGRAIATSSPVPDAAPLKTSTARPSRLPTATTTLGILQSYVQQRNYEGCAAYYEQHFDPSQQHFVDDFCSGFAADARDALLLLMRVYVSLGRIDKVREVFGVGLRDFTASASSTTSSPLAFAKLGRKHRDPRGDGSTTTSSASLNSAALSLHNDQRASRGTRQSGVWPRPSLLNASIFNGYLEALTRRNKFAVEEVVFLLDQMKAHGVAKDALTYHYLTELHVRAGYDPTGLWTEMHQSESRVTPLPATVQTILLRVVPYSSDPAFVVAVTRAALQHGTAIVDKRMLAELIVQWLSPIRLSQTDSNTHHRHREEGTMTTAQASRLGLRNPSHAPSPSTVQYPPEYVLWLMLELELRCVLEKASFNLYVQRQHLTELLLRCAKCTDAGTAEQVLALMDRHAVVKSAEVLALVVWCWSQALEVEKALDLIEWMALKGHLDHVDCFRKAYIESLRYTMDRHYLMIFVDSLSTPALVERALAHLHARRQRGELVSVHTLDLVVLALAKVGDERKALQLVSAYETRWEVLPRINSYNALLMGCARYRSTMMHRLVYRTLKNSGVVPNLLTFRVLIRQAVIAGHIAEAIDYLEEVTTYPGLRVEVEMVLPILERAARVGDVETANRISQYALKCDIGIDGSVLRNVMQHLTDSGQTVEVLKGQLPLHEALRSRSKAGRQRARNEVLV